MTDNLPVLAHHSNGDSETDRFSPLSSVSWEAKEELASHARVLSWDFCFEHFADLDRVRSDRQASCMQLGYYLASWGMLRGSSYLFKNTNARHYLQALDVIERYSSEMRELTPAGFGTQQNQELLVSAYQELGDALLPEGGRRITLVTKTMMGVWGCLSLTRFILRADFRGYC